jgi:hypothetical protein
MRRSPTRHLVIAFALLPSIVCSAPAAKVAEGPVAVAIRKGMASGEDRFDHAAWDALLARHVDRAGRVDYVGLLKNRDALDAYLSDVGRARLDRLSRGELLALLVNAYNACTLRLILDAARGAQLPASIRDLPDPWGRKTCTLGGQALSLDTLEHGLLRPLFKDTAIHAAVNCASKSCPPLAPRGYRGDRAEAQLAESLKEMVNSETYVRVEDGRLQLSKIFEWYQSDFTDPGFKGAAPTLAAFVTAHANPHLAQSIKALGPQPALAFMEYDWSLNGR